MFAFVAVYFALSMSLYLTLRRLRWMRTERGIFLFQLSLFLLFIITLPILAHTRMGHSDTVLWAYIGFGLHGIWSLSFLELWSLTEGSYSLSILNRVFRSAKPIKISTLSALSEIGVVKTKNRYAALGSLGLIAANENGALRLTLAGRLMRKLILAILLLTNGSCLNG